MKTTTAAYRAAMADRMRGESHVEIKAYHGNAIFVFQDDAIVTVSHKNEIDVLSRKLPIESVAFTISDVEGAYDPDNPTGKWAALDKNDKIEVRFGIDTPNGTQWLPADTYLLDGKPSVTAGQASFSASSRLLHAKKRYYKTSGNTVTLRALALSVLSDAGIESYSLDPCLALIKTNGTVIDTARNMLQRIAHAASCALYTSGDTLYIRRIAPASYDYQLPLSDITLGSDKTSKATPPYTISVNRYSYTADAEAKEIYRAIVDIDGSIDFHAEFDAAAGVYLTASPGATVKSVTPYAQAVDAVIRGAGTYEIAVNGRKISRETYKITEEVSEDEDGGSDSEDNVLITDSATADAVMFYTTQQLTQRAERTFKYRGNPEIEVGDAFEIERAAGNPDRAVIISNEIKFDGAISGTIKAKILRSDIGAPLRVSSQQLYDSDGEALYIVGAEPYDTEYSTSDINSFISAVLS